MCSPRAWSRKEYSHRMKRGNLSPKVDCRGTASIPCCCELGARKCPPKSSSSRLWRVIPAEPKVSPSAPVVSTAVNSSPPLVSFSRFDEPQKARATNSYNRKPQKDRLVTETQHFVMHEQGMSAQANATTVIKMCAVVKSQPNRPSRLVHHHSSNDCLGIRDRYGTKWRSFRPEDGSR